MSRSGKLSFKLPGTVGLVFLFGCLWLLRMVSLSDKMLPNLSMITIMLDLVNLRISQVLSREMFDIYAEFANIQPPTTQNTSLAIKGLMVELGKFVKTPTTTA